MGLESITLTISHQGLQSPEAAQGFVVLTLPLGSDAAENLKRGNWGSISDMLQGELRPFKDVRGDKLLSIFAYQLDWASGRQKEIETLWRLIEEPTSTYTGDGYAIAQDFFYNSDVPWYGSPMRTISIRKVLEVGEIVFAVKVFSLGFAGEPLAVVVSDLTTLAVIIAFHQVVLPTIQGVGSLIDTWMNKERRRRR